MSADVLPADGALRRLYADGLGLLTDLYQLTMAEGYLRSGLAERPAVFHLFFRRAPFGGGWALACGLGPLIEWLDGWRLGEDDLDYLASLEAEPGRPLFSPELLRYLKETPLRCDVDAIPEGTVVFPHEPLVRIRGPLLQAQILETALLNLINYPTLTATKAARICQAAAGDGVLEFGLRRAQGIDGGLSASRAAYVGGCAATSNVLAGKLLGIPVRGTHAHSWVMAFDSEEEAFASYAAAMPDNCVFLVDTYDTLEGVRRAAEVGRRLRRRGHEMVGVRLDSGDLAELARRAREILDEAGFSQARIFASNDLDEEKIAALKAKGAPIAVWGVGTHLVTGGGQGALGGVYKLAALGRPDGSWSPRVKRSEEAIKSSIPGVQQVRRYSTSAGWVGDLIHDESRPLSEAPGGCGLSDLDTRWQPPRGAAFEDLLVPVFRAGKRVSEPPGLEEIRRRSADQLGRLDALPQTLQQPGRYPVVLEDDLHALRQRLLESPSEEQP